MTDPDPQPFEAALGDILAPLARAMIAHGVTIAQATEMLKRAFLDAAELSSAVRLTDSRISAMTGLHRKDVKRLRDADAPPPKRETTGPAALVVGYWMGAPDFQNPDGTPRPLTRKGDDAAPGFDELVRRARVDLPPSTVLELLVVEGVVTEDAKRLHLARPGLIGRPASATQAKAFGRNLAVHLEAAVANLLAEDAPTHFERALHVNQLSAASRATLEAQARAAAARLLADLNTEALRLQDADATDETATSRFSLGTYIHTSPGPGDEEET